MSWKPSPLNFGSRLTGEARLVHEINSGLRSAKESTLVPDAQLSLHSGRIYRFFPVAAEQHVRASTKMRIKQGTCTILPAGLSPLALTGACRARAPNRAFAI